MNTNTELLAREISAARNGLMNAISTRKEHPTYGYTKADVLGRLHRLEGLLQAYHIVTTGEASASPSFDTFAAAKTLDIDLTTLSNRARAA